MRSRSANLASASVGRLVFLDSGMGSLSRVRLSMAPAVRQHTPADDDIVPSAKARPGERRSGRLTTYSVGPPRKRSLAQGVRQQAVTAGGAAGWSSGSRSMRDAA